MNIGQLLITAAVTAGKNIVGAIVGKTMLLWTLEYYAEQSGNAVSISAVRLVRAGLENDRKAIEAATKALIEELTPKRGG